jgi:polar amino acid transport system substrate-binding protein
MNKTVKILSLALALGLCGTGVSLAAAVKMGVAAEPYPPFSEPDASGKWVGWEIEFVEAVCAEAKIECEITPVAWDGIIPALTSGKIDAISSSMSITEERLKTIDFSNKYYNTPTGVIGPKDATFEATPEGLTGKILGVQVSTIHQAYATAHFGGKASEIKEYQTQDEANQDLAAGRLDAVQADSITLEAFLKSDAGACCKMIGFVADDPAILGAGVGFGLRKGEEELKTKLNAAIDAVRASGKYAEISKKYFSFDPYGK